MSLLQDFQNSVGSFDIAIIAATISILLGGILFGVGLGFGVRRLRLLGAEEIAQGIISAAMLGAIISFAALLSSATSSIVPAHNIPQCAQVEKPTSSPFSYYACFLSAYSSSFNRLAIHISRSSEIAGMVGTLNIKIAETSFAPFFALSSYSQQLSSLAFEMHSLSALAILELEVAFAIKDSALAFFLPAGLILRSFFATRKLGAAVMAIAVSAYLVYPLLFLHAFQSSKVLDASKEALEYTERFNQTFASIPLLDFDSPGQVKAKIGQMAQQDFSDALQPIFSTTLRAISLAKTDLIIYPLVSILVSAVAAIEFYRIFSATVFLSFIDSI
ncbi:MAG: hypothetical protein N3G80_04115 [Candidatus Micrarchaeota archaeon]|nr:hypothetical protein [Candidatus Micrarchaeota archaeon]